MAAALSPGNLLLQTSGAAPFLLPWSTDASEQDRHSGHRPHLPASYGPDGPWQAVVVGVGELNTSSADSRPAPAPHALYPCGSSVTQVVGKQLGGIYSIEDSRTAVPLHDAAANVEDWFACIMMNESTYGSDAFDGVHLVEAQAAAKRSQRSFTAVSTVFAASGKFDINLPSGRAYQNNVGVLGLGPWQHLNPGPPRDGPLSMPQQLYHDGLIPSDSFGLHIGSVAENISGSLALGGYDVSRALEPVGSFWYKLGTPFAALRDINLGVEVGGSPFDTDDLEHLYLGNNGSKAAEHVRESFGAPEGSTIVIPNPATPYISLPRSNCENIAKRLPVTWHEDIGFYTWDQDDPRYAKIVNSPAWMQFVLQGPDGTDLSIKVPFKLLNLTLEWPIVPEPMPYFPCRPWNSGYGFYALGRAFLQGAFLGVNYGNNALWLAQAPGPGAAKPDILPIQPQDTTLKTLPMDNFASSWAGFWEPLPAEESTWSAERSAWSHCIHDFSPAHNMFLSAMVAFCAVAWAVRRRNKTTKAPERRDDFHVIDAKH